MGQRVAARLLPVALACVAMLASPCAVSQDVNPFTFDFKPRPEGERHTFRHVFCSVEDEINHNCNRFATPEVQAPTSINQNQLYWDGNFANDMESRFIQELVVIEGVEYFHVVIGDPDSDFVQEIYIARSDWRRDRELAGGRFSDSGGQACFPGPAVVEPFASGCIASNNAYDPLRRDSNFTGNATGNPSRMVMLQRVKDEASGYEQNFSKFDLATKPVISQTLVNEDIESVFSMDMSNSDYDTDSIAGTMVNTFDLRTPGITEAQNLIVPNVIPTMGDFDLAVTERPENRANITGGRYTFNRIMLEDYRIENGWFRDIPTSEYTYYDGMVDTAILNTDWEKFRDPGQNPASLD